MQEQMRRIAVISSIPLWSMHEQIVQGITRYLNQQGLPACYCFTSGNSLQGSVCSCYPLTTFVGFTGVILLPGLENAAALAAQANAEGISVAEICSPVQADEKWKAGEVACIALLEPNPPLRQTISAPWQTQKNQTMLVGGGAAQYERAFKKTTAWHYALTAREHLTEWVAQLHALMDAEHDYETCAVCLTGHWVEAEQWTEAAEMQAVLYRRAGDWQTPVSFPLEQLLPDADWKQQSNESWWFLPLWYEDHCLGYFAIAGVAYADRLEELIACCRTLTVTLESVRKIQNLLAMNTVLERLSAIDPLTRLYNRNGFVRESTKLYQEAIVQQTPVLLMFADLDGLKEINDQFGHTQGDAALREAGAILQSICAQDEICCRFGGDEFLIFSTHATPAAGDALIAAFNAAAQAFSAAGDIPFCLSMSMGYHIAIPQEGTSVFHLITTADHNMYEEKKRRKQSRYLRKDASAPIPQNDIE